MGWPPAFVARQVHALGRRRSARRTLVICRRHDGRPLGLITLGTAAEAWTIGIVFGAEGRGHGFGAGALGAVLPWVRSGGAPKAVLETAVTDVAMRRAAEAVGFRAVGTTEDRPLPDGSRVTAVCDVREW